MKVALWPILRHPASIFGAAVVNLMFPSIPRIQSSTPYRANGPTLFAGRSFFMFCGSIYPKDTRSTTNGLIDEGRMEFAKSLDQFGQKIYHKEGLALAEIFPIVRSQARFIKIITFLEFAKAAQQDALGVGKYGLFYLCSKLPS
jgi:hypothetical protein